jgi:pimeloyl-ACP methyl ester carboxylesterase
MSNTTRRNHRSSFRGGVVHWEEWLPKGNNEGADRADRRPIVLLHGLADTCRTWNHLAPVLGRDRRVYALDLPGHGDSSRYDSSYDVHWYGELIAEWIRSLDIPDFDLMGHSLGGGIAMRVLMEKPARVHRLVLVAAGGLGLEVAMPLRLAATTGLLDRVVPELMGMGTHAGVRVLGGNFNADERRHLAEVNARPGTARTLSRTLRGALDMKGQREHMMDYAQHMGDLPPIAVYWGDEDPVLPVRHAERLHHYIDGVIVRRYPNVGHYPHREAVPEMLPDLLWFLDEPQRIPKLRHKVKAPRAAAEQGFSLWRMFAEAKS